MLEFFEALLIFTGGILCVVAWLALVIGVGIEIYDFFTRRSINSQIEDEDPF